MSVVIRDASIPILGYLTPWPLLCPARALHTSPAIH